MATEVLLIKEGGKLAAADPISAETLEGLRGGEVVRCTIRRPRNYRFHCKFMAMLTEIFKNQDKYPTFAHLLETVKIGIGHCDWLPLPGPIPMLIPHPRSISFAKMGEWDFEQFYNRAVDYVLAEIIPGTDRGDLERRVLELIAWDQRRL